MEVPVENVFARKAVKKVSAVFAGIIIFLTFFSQTINNLLVPVVEVSTPSAGVIQKTMEFSGEVKVSAVRKVFIYTKGRVNRIGAKAGMRIDSGLAIASVDIGDAELEKKKRELELERMENELAKALSKAAEPDLSSYRSDIAMAEYDVRIQQLNLLSVKAQQGNIPYKTLLEAESKVEAAELALERKQKLLEQKITEAQRAADEQKVSINIMQRELGIKKEEYAAFMASFPADGAIVSPVSGTVRSILVEEGTVCMPGQSIAEIIPDDARYLVRWRLDEKRAVLMGQGSKVVIETGGNDKKALKSIVTEVTYLSKEGLYEYSAEIDTKDLAVSDGQRVKVKFEQDAKRFLTVVPGSAAVSVGSDAYCIYVLKDRKTILGSEKYVQRIDAEIEDSDDRSAAIKTNTPLGGNDKVIVYSTKPLDDGMQVRLK